MGEAGAGAGEDGDRHGHLDPNDRHAADHDVEGGATESTGLLEMQKREERKERIAKLALNSTFHFCEN